MTGKYAANLENTTRQIFMVGCQGAWKKIKKLLPAV
jgi:hypothetical protein